MGASSDSFLSPKSARARREKALALAVRENEYEDAIVIPASMMPPSTHTPLLPSYTQVKEIFTPKWKQAQGTATRSSGGADAAAGDGATATPAQLPVSGGGQEQHDSVRLVNNGYDAAGELLAFDDSPGESKCFFFILINRSDRSDRREEG